MSANNKFWANVNMLRAPQVNIHLYNSEKDDLDRAIHAASKSNVITGIDCQITLFVERLLKTAIERMESSKKQYDSYYRRAV